MIAKVYSRSRRLAGAVRRRLFRAPKVRDSMVPYRPPTIRPEALKARQGPFRVAVIGAGNQGRDICAGIATLDGARVVAVADRSEEALARLKAQVSLPQASFYNDAQRLLNSESADLVCVATPTPTHIALASMAVESGVNCLLMEKPIGTCPEEARQFLELCAERGVRLAVNHSRRWSLDYAAMKRYIAGGKIGSPRQVYVAFGRSGLGRMGVHFFDLMRFFLDSEAIWAIGYLDPVSGQNGSSPDSYDPEGYGMLGFSNGARGFIDLSQDLLRKDAFFVIKTEYGRIEIDERARRWTIVSETGQTTVPFVDTTSPAGYGARVVAELLSDKTPRSSGADGLAALETVIALHLSHQQGHQPVTLPLTAQQRLTQVALV